MTPAIATVIVLAIGLDTSSTRCSLGVGCDESGICYADAHGDLSKCGSINHAAERAKAEHDSQPPPDNASESQTEDGQ